MKNTNGTKRLYIYIMEKKDLEELRKLHNEDGTLTKLSNVDHVSELDQEKWFFSMSESKQSKRYTVRLRTDNQLVGIFKIDNIDLVNKSAIVGADVVEHLRQQGYAKEMYEYFFNHLFKNQGFHRLGLVTLENNNAAISLYEKIGFKKEGKEREAIFRNGKYYDLLTMSILSNEWGKTD